MFCEPDGDFLIIILILLLPKNMEALSKAVIENKYELGIGLDGDAVRIGVVDEQGKLLLGDQILNILAGDYLKHNPGKKIIADVKCSMNLFNDIIKYGGEPIMYKTGHANIKMYMQEKKVEFAGEMSGHIFFWQIDIWDLMMPSM